MSGGTSATLRSAALTSNPRGRSGTNQEIAPVFYETRDNKHGLRHDPFKALVVPRPIGWISTVGKNGICNIAPYSFFNAVGERPHYVVFSSAGRKDSLLNIEETGEFVCSLATWDLRYNMNMTSASVPRGVDEFPIGDLTAAPEPPRQAAARQGKSGGVRVQALEDHRAAASRPGRQVHLLGRVRPGGRHLHRRRLRQGRHGRHRRHAPHRPARLHGLCGRHARDRSSPSTAPLPRRLWPS